MGFAIVGQDGCLIAYLAMQFGFLLLDGFYIFFFKQAYYGSELALSVANRKYVADDTICNTDEVDQSNLRSM